MFDLTQPWYTQIDEDTSIKWDQLTKEEQFWLYNQILGRDPVPGEIDNQISIGKSIKYFVHGAQEELKTRSQNGDDWAKAQLKATNQWESSIENSIFDSIADFTGINELENPLGWAADTVGIKEIEEYGKLAIQVGGSIASVLTGNPMPAVAAASLNEAMTPGSDVMSVGQQAAESFLVERYLPENAIAKAGATGALAAAHGGSMEDVALSAFVSYAGDAIAATTTDVNPIITNKSIFEAGVNYAVNRDPRNAAILLAANSAINAAENVADGGHVDMDFEGSFKEWMKQDYQNSLKEMKDLPMTIKADAISKPSAALSNFLKGRGLNTMSQAEWQSSLLTDEFQPREMSNESRQLLQDADQLDWLPGINLGSETPAREDPFADSGSLTILR